MGGLDIIKDDIKQYFMGLIEQGKQEVEITEANANIQKIIKGYEETNEWISVDEAVPTDGRHVLISFENFSLPEVGRYEEDEEGGAWYIGDDDISCSDHMLFVNAWMDLPEPYKGKKEKKLDSLELSIDTLNLSTRAYNCIRRAGINSIRDLCSRTPEEMMRFRDMGRKTLDEVVQKMAKNGLEFTKEKEK